MPALCSNIEPRIGRVGSNVPLVSVIIPAYNYEAYVSLAIQSVLSQSYPNIEIVVVDDGSADGTADAVKKFADSVRCFSKKNEGLAAARNFGIRKSKGEFLLFLDADDELEENAIERLYDCMVELSEEYALTACIFSKINERGDFTGVQGNIPTEECDVTCRQLVMRNRFPVTALIRRAAIINCGMFDPEYGTVLGSEDRDMWVRLAAVYKIRMLNAPLLRKREHDLNMSSKVTNQHKGMLKTIAKARSFGVVSSKNLTFWAQVSAVRHFQVALMRHGCDDRAGAWLSLLQSVIVWPYFFSLRQLGFVRFFRMRCALRWIIRRGG